MTLVTGASQYLSQSAYASSQGQTYQSPSVLGTSTAGAANLLDVGRRNAVYGVGLSSSARYLNRQQLESNSSTVNGLFSLTGGGSATVEAAKTQIMALRASLPERQLFNSQQSSDTSGGQSSDSASAQSSSAARGQTVDQTA